MKKTMFRLAAGLLVGLGLTGSALAQPAAGIERIKVHGKALEGNLEGNAADRDVIVVLPPSYGTAKSRRYPVVYFLHGFMQTADSMEKFGKFASTWQAAEAKGAEMIMVMPDSMTRHGGSMYSSSATVGDFEAFVARDLVAYIDSHYRTLAKRESRGLAGHSMGGYGTLRIGMKYPQVYSSIYAMSACCLSAGTMTPERGKAMEAMSLDQATKADFGTRAAFASAAAWSPDPGRAPLFFDLPTKDGAVQPQRVAEWAANAPLAMAPQYVAGLKTLTAIGLDVGDKDTLVADNRAMHDLFDRFGIRHDWEVYDGDHINRIAARFPAKVAPFFAAHLKTK